MNAIRACIGTVILILLCETLPAQDTVINGVTISFGIDRHTFPNRWLRKNISAEAVSLPDTCMPRAQALMAQALTRYPVSMPCKYLKRVHIFKSLRFYGYPYGGTYRRKAVYLTFDPGHPMSGESFLEERFHHEFSSILWKENHRKLDLDAWMSFNPPGFVYGEGGIDAIQEGIASMETDPGYFAIGFLNRYAMTEIEQDINCIAQYLFCGGPEFWKIVDENERIRGKVILLVDFYHQLNPMFTEPYFRNLNKF